MKCPYCGNEHPESTRFCPLTGQEIKAAASYCQKCGQVIAKDASFCPYCGSKQGSLGGPAARNQAQHPPYNNLFIALGLVYIFMSVLLLITGESVQSIPSKLTFFKSNPLLVNADQSQFVASFSSEEVPSVKFSPNHDIFGVIRNGRIIVYETATLEIIQTFFAPGTIDYSFSKDGDYLSTATTDNQVNLWRISDGSNIGRIVVTGSRVTTISFVNNPGNIVAGGFADGTVALWQLDKNRVLDTYDIGGYRIQQIQSSPNGDLLGVCPSGQPTQFISVLGGKITPLFQTGEIEADNLFYSSLGKYVVLVSDPNSYLIKWEENNQETVREWSCEDFTAAFNYNDQYLAVSCGERFEVWDLNKDKRIVNEKEENGIRHISFMPGSNSLLLFSDSGSIWYRAARDESNANNINPESSSQGNNQFVGGEPFGMPPQSNEQESGSLPAQSKTTSVPTPKPFSTPTVIIPTIVPTSTPPVKVPNGMTYIPGGAFIMGASEEEMNWHINSCNYYASCSKVDYLDMSPEHQVEVNPFLMDVHEVTNSQYRECVNAGICGNPNTTSIRRYLEEDYFDNTENDEHPVVAIRYQDAVKYCEWVGNKRLPTEAEWEFAAKGNADQFFPWVARPSGTNASSVFGSNTPKANFCDHDCPMENWKETRLDDGWIGPAPVMSYEAGPFGLYDMAGNVSEWTLDFYGDRYYSSSPTKNPINTSASDYRVTRGGGWNNGIYHLSSVFRSYQKPDNPKAFIGFRCVQDITE